jgi:hypothetical protein
MTDVVEVSYWCMVTVGSAHVFFIFFHVRSVCFAKHVQKKAAKWAKDKRPRKSRLSDINRTPVVYELRTMEKPPEYTISEAAPVLAVKPVKVASSSSE